MVGDKITEKVVLWFLMWLSKITCEVAETTQTSLRDSRDSLIY